MKNHHIRKNTKQFFEGWYFKHQNGDETIAFIPGIHIDKKRNAYAFIQVITQDQSYVIRYAYEDFYAGKNKFFVKIGKSVFSKKGILVDIQMPELTCRGKIEYGAFTPIQYDIMGPFSLLPAMECNHGIISLYHAINGKINLNNKEIDFANGTGYIEKDWGCSFPKNYTWLQCNDFKTKSSIVVSVADIPFCGSVFKGLIAIVYDKGKEYRFATYNGGKVLYNNAQGLMIKRGHYRLKATVEQGEGHPLEAPGLGDMNRIVHECASCPAHFEFFIGKKRVLSKRSKHASFEHVEHELGR